MKQGQVGVYKLFKLGRLNSQSFTHDFKTLERDSHVINHDYAERINKYSVMNGLHYEYDEVSDKLYWLKKPFKVSVEFTDFEEILDSGIDNLKLEYESLSGKKAHTLWKNARLIEEISKLKTE